MMQLHTQTAGNVLTFENFADRWSSHIILASENYLVIYQYMCNYRYNLIVPGASTKTTDKFHRPTAKPHPYPNLTQDLKQFPYSTRTLPLLGNTLKIQWWYHRAQLCGITNARDASQTRGNDLQAREVGVTCPAGQRKWRHKSQRPAAVTPMIGFWEAK